MCYRIFFAFLLLSNLEVAAQSDYEPYGTMYVNDALIADQTEIIVAEWLGYIVSACDTNKLRSQQSWRRMSAADKQYLTEFRYPDTLLPTQTILETLEWRNILDSTGNYRLLKTDGANSRQIIPVNADYFTSHEKQERLHYLLQLPVTGISYAQALAFCRWRTQIDSMLYQSGWGFAHYVFRLPTVAEFNFMNLQCDSTIVKFLRSSSTVSWQYRPAGYNYRNVSVKLPGRLSKQNDLHDVWEFCPDRRGLYAVQGNAAEMTAREGAACGGSYFHYARESYRYEIQTYEHSERWLGFRCVAQLKQ
jgi:hypothetical protein